MTVGHGIVFGLVQGLTEFLPISSSGHLKIMADFLGWAEPDTFFTIAVHLGTLLAVLIYFGRDWVKIFVKERPLLWSIIMATGVTGLMALPLAGPREALDSATLTAWMLIIFGLLLWIVDLRAKVSPKKVPGWWASVWLGIAQAVALVPGVSRSGVVITAARGLKMDRVEATRYAFLLSTPTIALTPLVLLTNIVPSDHIDAAVVVGFLVAALSGWLAIAWLMQLVKKTSFGWFALYRIVLAIVILILLH